MVSKSLLLTGQLPNKEDAIMEWWLIVLILGGFIVVPCLTYYVSRAWHVGKAAAERSAKKRNQQS